MPDEIPIAKPVAPVPTIQPAPPAGRKFPCPSCGARLDFDPTVRGLKCPYCGYLKEILREDSAEVAERDYIDYMEREEAHGKAIPGRSSETRCPGCGANVLLEDKMVTEKCPFCLTHLENKPEAVHTMIAPESVLPFTVDLRKAREAFDAWLSSLWFAPNELRKIATLGQLSGIYLPYWTYDAMTISFYSGQRGDNYTTTESYRDSNGATQTRTVTHTRWTSVSGDVQHFFDDVLICASKSLPADLITDLGLWPLNKLEPFQPDFLSGFKTERYGIDLKEGYQNSKRVMEPIIIQLIQRDIGGDQQQISDRKTRYSAVTFKPLLLPLWVAVYRYNDKTFQILVNGRTAKVTGYRPWSTWKIIRLVLLILLASSMIVYLLFQLKQ